MFYSTNGSEWEDSLEVGISDVPLTAGAEYEADVAYNGTSLVFTFTDGTHTKTLEAEPSAALYHSSSYKIAFGGIAQNSNLIASGISFDPDNTFIESNGSLVWGAKPV